LNRGLKTQSKYYNTSSGAWNLQRTESYGYDANLNYLTSSNYGDGLANATPSWTYDAAGNRISNSTVSGSWTYDNLNRMTASPGYTYINTLTGNRLERTGSSAWNMRHSWDVLNRMTQSYVNGSNDVVSMTYRVDGLRVAKANAVPGNNANKFTHYRYDGRMGIEDVEVTSGGTYNSVTRYVLGARGIDSIARTTSGGTIVSYPLYDAHGNNTGLITKSGSSWSISDERSYDSWGQVRSGSATGNQKGRFGAAIGHKQDDESGLVYMRARYFEPTSGRFISEDPGMDGQNWFIYCKNNPIEFVDSSGKFIEKWAQTQGIIASLIFLLTESWDPKTPKARFLKCIIIGLDAAVAGVFLAASGLKADKGGLSACLAIGVGSASALVCGLLALRNILFLMMVSLLDDSDPVSKDYIDGMDSYADHALDIFGGKKS
jgi:RHS repeat-associated protein